MATALLGLTNTFVALDTLPAADVDTMANQIEATRAGRAALNVAGSGAYVLSAAEDDKPILDCTGVLTGNRTVQVPLTAGARWLVRNGSSGAFTLTAIGSSGTGVIIPQGGGVAVYTDGTNVYAEDAGGLQGLSAGVVADLNVISALPVLHRVDVPAGTTGDVDVTITHKIRVLDVWLVKRVAAGGGAGTIQVKSTAAVITDAMSINVADQTVVRCATIDDAAHEIAAGGILRCTRTRTASTDETCSVYVLAVRVA